eukprot:7125713-Prymnesium_polylepis.1
MMRGGERVHWGAEEAALTSALPRRAAVRQRRSRIGGRRGAGAAVPPLPLGSKTKESSSCPFRVGV